MDPERHFLHFVDGGVADNIGLRAPYHAITSSDTLQMNESDPMQGFSVPRMINDDKVKRVIVIAVNARTVSELNHDRRQSTPGIIPVVANVSGTPMANYSFDTVTMVQETFTALNTSAELAKKLREINCIDTDTPDVRYDFVEVAFNLLPADQQKHFNDMGTNYSLSKQDVADLITAAGKILDDSDAFKTIVKELQ